MNAQSLLVAAMLMASATAFADTAAKAPTISAALASPLTSMSHTIATATPREMEVGSAPVSPRTAVLSGAAGRAVAKVRSSSLTR